MLKNNLGIDKKSLAKISTDSHSENSSYLFKKPKSIIQGCLEEVPTMFRCKDDVHGSIVKYISDTIPRKKTVTNTAEDSTSTQDETTVIFNYLLTLVQIDYKSNKELWEHILAYFLQELNKLFLEQEEVTLFISYSWGEPEEIDYELRKKVLTFCDYLRQAGVNVLIDYESATFLDHYIKEVKNPKNKVILLGTPSLSIKCHKPKTLDLFIITKEPTKAELSQIKRAAIYVIDLKGIEDNYKIGIIFPGEEELDWCKVDENIKSTIKQLLANRDQGSYYKLKEQIIKLITNESIMRDKIERQGCIPHYVAEEVLLIEQRLKKESNFLLPIIVQNEIGEVFPKTVAKQELINLSAFITPEKVIKFPGSNDCKLSKNYFEIIATLWAGNPIELQIRLLMDRYLSVLKNEKLAQLFETYADKKNKEHLLTEAQYFYEQSLKLRQMQGQLNGNLVNTKELEKKISSIKQIRINAKKFFQQGLKFYEKAIDISPSLDLTKQEVKIFLEKSLEFYSYAANLDKNDHIMRDYADDVEKHILHDGAFQVKRARLKMEQGKIEKEPGYLMDAKLWYLESLANNPDNTDAKRGLVEIEELLKGERVAWSPPRLLDSNLEETFLVKLYRFIVKKFNPETHQFNESNYKELVFKYLLKEIATHIPKEVYTCNIIQLKNKEDKEYNNKVKQIKSYLLCLGIKLIDYDEHNNNGKKNIILAAPELKSICETSNNVQSEEELSLQKKMMQISKLQDDAVLPIVLQYDLYGDSPFPKYIQKYENKFPDLTTVVKFIYHSVEEKHRQTYDILLRLFDDNKVITKIIRNSRNKYNYQISQQGVISIIAIFQSHIFDLYNNGKHYCSVYVNKFLQGLGITFDNKLAEKYIDQNESYFACLQLDFDRIISNSSSYPVEILLKLKKVEKNINMIIRNGFWGNIACKELREKIIKQQHMYKHHTSYFQKLYLPISDIKKQNKFMYFNQEIKKLYLPTPDEINLMSREELKKFKTEIQEKIDIIGINELKRLEKSKHHATLGLLNKALRNKMQTPIVIYDDSKLEHVEKQNITLYFNQKSEKSKKLYLPTSNEINLMSREELEKIKMEIQKRIDTIGVNELKGFKRNKYYATLGILNKTICKLSG